MIHRKSYEEYQADKIMLSMFYEPLKKGQAIQEHTFIKINGGQCDHLSPTEGLSVNLWQFELNKSFKSCHKAEDMVFFLSS